MIPEQSLNLSGKVALISGAGVGIGRARHGPCLRYRATAPQAGPAVAHLQVHLSSHRYHRPDATNCFQLLF